MMRLLTLPLRLLFILALAVLVSGAWLMRRDLIRALRPQVARLGEALSSAAVEPDTRNLARARAKIDSMHGWGVDSVILTAGEMASLIASGLPPKISAHFDSLSVELGEGRVRISARLETAQIPRDVLGPLAGAMDAWERVVVEGPVVATATGRAEWRVDALSVRGFTLPAETSRRLIERGLPGARDGAVPLVLPRGISGLRIRPTGVAVYPEETR
jgi:hypothetical protein